MLQTNAKVFQCLRTKCVLESLEFLNPRINMQSNSYINAMSVCVILISLTWPFRKFYSILYRQTLEKFKWKNVEQLLEFQTTSILYTLKWAENGGCSSARYATTLHHAVFAFFRILFFVGCLKSILIHSNCVHAQRLM